MGKMILDRVLEWRATEIRRHSAKQDSAAIWTWFGLGPVSDLISEFKGQIFRVRKREGWIIMEEKSCN
jgi:hypothetical protein